MDDNQALVYSLKDSPFFKPFKEEAQVWEDNLSRLAYRLNVLNSIQRKWLYLEPIFARGALPQEQPRFRKVDQDFLKIMSDIHNDPLVVSFAERPRLESILDNANEQLDACQRALSQFLEEKRGHFPRFYFIGDDDLLEILGQASNPEVIQAHLKKLFAGINKVEFDKGMTKITAMLSSEGERVPLHDYVHVHESVESWLSQLADNMKRTLHHQLLDCQEKQNYQKHCSQVSLRHAAPEIGKAH